MKCVIDKEIPFIQGVLEPYAEVVYLECEAIDNEVLRDADALIVRTRTICNEALLHDTSVRMIATTTIGTDNIDYGWCNAHGIQVTNAAGCNVGGVVQYVFSALFGVAARKNLSLDGMTMGVVGVGNVGSRVAQVASKLGFNVQLCDPVRAQRERLSRFCSLEQLLVSSDIVTMHVPLDDSTRGMADKAFFDQIHPGAIFINTSYGAVVDDEALIASLPKFSAVIIDAWNNEPDINHELMEMVDIATPHIAGYSYQGKQDSTAVAVRAVARHFGISGLDYFYPTSPELDLCPQKLHLDGKTQGEIAAIFQYNYPIFTDDFMFRISPNDFAKLRQNYKYRREVIF